MNLNVLAIVAHPADSFDMIGRILANYASDGDHVTLVIMDSTDTLNLFTLADKMKKEKIDRTRTQARMYCPGIMPGRWTAPR